MKTTISISSLGTTVVIGFAVLIGPIRVWADDVHDLEAWIALNSDRGIRGAYINDKHHEFGLGASYYGVSAAASISEGEPASNSGNFINGMLSYGYALGAFDVSIGFERFEFLSFSGRQENDEVFVEFYGNPNWNDLLPFGILPSFRQSFQLNGSSANFTELKLEKQIVRRDSSLVFNPYVELGAGRFYTTSWELNHIEMGADLTWEFSPGIFLSAHVSAIEPLSALDTVSPANASENRFSLMLRYSPSRSSRRDRH